jgi:cytochrome c553
MASSPRRSDFRTLPDPSTRDRYSDEQLYALALYLYSRQSPPNPNSFDARAKRGQEVFRAQGCGNCHTPPLYTNNKLTPTPASRFRLIITRSTTF